MYQNIVVRISIEKGQTFTRISSAWNLAVEIPSAIRFEDDIARKTNIDLNKEGSDQILESESAGTRTVKQQLEDSNSKNNLSSKESLPRWQLQSRPGRRLVEIKAMFEYKQADPSSLEGLKMSSPSNVKEVINRAFIKTYFDMIGRDGCITAGIGEYLHLSKENIFGGTDCESQNDRVTFVNVDLCQSIINLADNRVDLITCFVTLHHIPEFELMLSEFVCIIRLNGYLIIREHDCKKERTLQAKYLNFIHAFVMIARVDEFGSIQNNHSEHNQVKSDGDLLTHTINLKQQKSNIIEYMSSIQYQIRTKWQQKLENVDSHLRTTLDYDQNPSTNPQTSYYAVFQLNLK
ncbi:unnamed protein product [Rotaria socialis]